MAWLADDFICWAEALGLLILRARRLADGSTAWTPLMGLTRVTETSLRSQTTWSHPDKKSLTHLPKADLLTF